MKYKDLADEILDHSDSADHLHEVMDLVIGKAINQERIQIYKTLAIYFSELTEKNKAYLVQKIEVNQVILDERCAKLASNDIFTSTNDFFDLQEGMEQIRIDKNLMKQYGTINVDELAAERPPVRDGGLFTTTNVTYNTGIAPRIAGHHADGATITFTNAQDPQAVPQPIEVDAGALRRVERGRQMEQRVMQTLQELAINPATVPLGQVDWVTIAEEALDEFEEEDEQE